MKNLSCTTCGDFTDSREMMTCRGCGALVCPGCAAQNGYLCDSCYGDLSYMN
ncbi:MAG: hypothetical protein FWE62_04130 [Firmicutes bacterium]|nr:hypothetical protein [Bacillota bacterium]